MKISEIFYSIQGEGKRSGVPSLFIRTNYCNLRCRFTGGNLCDTAYTSWNPEDEYNRGIMNVEEIIEECRKYPVKEAVITGGEPAMQAEELTELCKRLKEKGYFITLETNGTIFGEFADFIDLMSVSPKLSNSVPYGTEFENMHEKNRIDMNVLKHIHENHISSIYDIQWKFVISDEKDIPEILALQSETAFSGKDVYLMPEGITENQLKEKRPLAADLCKKYKFNYTDRLHILIWGGMRGV
ncbi:MAG: 7-carboxy-7-deazaguanine synthase QueE [Ignavibacteria bacterium]|nr:7-carboxy-7-deazaguanine synthase QueE [Ignavibacteria bacterium]